MALQEECLHFLGVLTYTNSLCVHEIKESVLVINFTGFTIWWLQTGLPKIWSDPFVQLVVIK